MKLKLNPYHLTSPKVWMKISAESATEAIWWAPTETTRWTSPETATSAKAATESSAIKVRMKA